MNCSVSMATLSIFILTTATYIDPSTQDESPRKKCLAQGQYKEINIAGDRNSGESGIRLYQINTDKCTYILLCHHFLKTTGHSNTFHPFKGHIQGV